MAKKKKTPPTEPKSKALSSKGDEALAEANAITPISLFTVDGREIRTTVQWIEDVVNKEREVRRREGRSRKNP